MSGFGERQGAQVREKHPVIAEVRGVVPGFQAHRGVQVGPGGAQGRGAGVAAGELIGDQQLQERGVAHLLVPGQHEALGQGVLEPGELQVPQDPLQIGADRVHRPRRGGGGAELVHRDSSCAVGVSCACSGASVWEKTRCSCTPWPYLGAATTPTVPAVPELSRSHASEDSGHRAAFQDGRRAHGE